MQIPKFCGKLSSKFQKCRSYFTCNLFKSFNCTWWRSFAGKKKYYITRVTRSYWAYPLYRRTMHQIRKRKQISVFCGSLPFKQAHDEHDILSLVHMSTPNGSQTAREWFVKQMCVCVDWTVNLRCTIRRQFAYLSPRMEMCQFFAQTQREQDASASFPCTRYPLLASGLLKIINGSPSTCCARTAQRVSGTLVDTKRKIVSLIFFQLVDHRLNRLLKNWCFFDF